MKQSLSLIAAFLSVCAFGIARAEAPGGAFAPVLAAVLACPAMNGATYYVATNGRDTNRGTSLQSPFQTIRHAAARMVAGDTCYIRGGVYRETLTPVASGTDSAPIVFAPYQGEIVTISGADIISKWARYSENIYSAPMDWDLGMGYNQVFVDGELMIQARFPKMAANNSLFDPALSTATVAADSVVSKDFSLPDGYWAGGYVVGRVNYSWSWQWGKIIGSSSNGTLKIENGSKPILSPAFGDITWFTGAGQVYLTGKLAALGSPKEWHFERHTLFLWAPASDNPDPHLVEAKRRAWTVDFNGRDFVVVDGLHLSAGAVRMNGNHCTLQNCVARFMSHFTIFPWSGYDGTGGAADGHQGIVVMGSDNGIKKCAISDTAGSAVSMVGAGNLVLRCVIHDVDYSGTYGSPINLTGSKNRVWFNTIYNAGRDIIYLGGEDNDIRYNDLSHPGMLCKDLGVVYSGFGGGQGSRIAYNWIHDNPIAIKGIGPGIYLDNYCRNFVVDHNVVWNCVGDAGIRLNGPTAGNRVYNNTLFNCDDIGTHMYDCWPAGNPDASFWVSSVYGFDSANNLYLAANPSSQLLDVPARDFRLVRGSGAIDAGAAIPGYTDGYKGSAPDKGAYESGGVRWTAGVGGVAADGPFVTNGDGASNLTGTRARISGQIGSTYFQPTHLIVFWGTSDGETSRAAWANSLGYDFTADGPFGADLTGLKPNTTYYYRCYASNATGEVWANTSTAFRTQ